MDSKTKILLIAGILVTIILAFFDIYLAGIVGIIFIAIFMSLLIMKDTTGWPEVVAKLRDDAKAIVLSNTGNARAEKIHVTLIPLNTDYDIPSLEVDAVYEIPVEMMIQEIKVVLSYTGETGRMYSGSAKLSAFGEDPDLLKPMIPIFKWKK
jgi:uncharacterized protein involved in high-affinity Fe2+ transport